MARTKISEFSSTPANNTDIDSINIAEGCAPSGINDAIRELMSQLKDWQSGTSNDPMVIGSSGSLTLNQGTANGVTYLNGSKVVTSGSALTFDGTNLGVGVSSPNQLLDVRGANGIGIRFLETSTGNTNRVQLGTGSGFGYIDATAGSGSTALAFQVASSEQMRLTSTGLGIGTSSPSSKLDIVGITQWQATAGTVLGKLTYSGGEPTVLANTGLGLQFFTNNAFAAKIDSSGNFGIGTSSPSYKLDVAGVARSDSWIGRTNGSAPTADCAMYRPADNSLGFSTANTERARIDSSGNLLVGTTTAVEKVTVNGRVQCQWNAYVNGGNTSYSGDASSLVTGSSAGMWAARSDSALLFSIGSTERARIDSSGNLLVGTTSGSGNNERVNITSSTNQTARFVNTNATSGNISIVSTLGANTDNTSSYHFLTATNGATRFYVYGNGTSGNASDQNLKKNIETTRDGYAEDLCKLRVVKYNWNDQADGSPKELGWIAQEVEQVFPNLVQNGIPNENGETFKEVKTSVLPFMLLKAIQEQQAIIESLKARLDAANL